MGPSGSTRRPGWELRRQGDVPPLHEILPAPIELGARDAEDGIHGTGRADHPVHSFLAEVLGDELHDGEGEDVSAVIEA